jgi:ankyrin repeat protein
VAIRPLEVKELAEVLAVDFDDADRMPKLKTNWHWEDQEQALLNSCSSLIAVVEIETDVWELRRVVQFSHFSVKEYLTSARLATSSADVSRYHIDLEPAHTILAQACMSILLQPDNGVEESGIVEKRSPLAGYAAQHWIIHVQFERVSSFLQKAMEYLFDLDMPYFTAWLQLYDIDTYPEEGSSSLHMFAVYSKSDVTPLYLAALCGFQNLVEHLIVKYPQHVNTSGGCYVTPLVAALAGRHFQTAKLLHHKGAHVNVRGDRGETTLCSAAFFGDLEMVRVLLALKVDVNGLGMNSWTPIYNASQGPGSAYSHASYNNPQLLADVARLLLEHGADVNAPIEHGDSYDESRTPLHTAADYGRAEVVRVLLEHGASVGAEDNKSRTPLHEAVDYGKIEANYGRVEGYVSQKVDVVRVLLEHCANVGAEDNEGRTPLHTAAKYGWVEVVRLLLEHGADVGVEDNKGRTPLHEAVEYESGEDYASGKVEVVRVLFEHGANVGAEDDQGRTPLHIAAKYGEIEVVRMLLERGANVGVEDNKGRTPFRMASTQGKDETMKLLLEHGAKGIYSISISSLCLP